MRVFLFRGTLYRETKTPINDWPGMRPSGSAGPVQMLKQKAHPLIRGVQFVTAREGFESKMIGAAQALVVAGGALRF